MDNLDLSAFRYTDPDPEPPAPPRPIADLDLSTFERPGPDPEPPARSPRLKLKRPRLLLALALFAFVSLGFLFYAPASFAFPLGAAFPLNQTSALPAQPSVAILNLASSTPSPSPSETLTPEPSLELIPSKIIFPPSLTPGPSLSDQQFPSGGPTPAKIQASETADGAISDLQPSPSLPAAPGAISSPPLVSSPQLILALRDGLHTHLYTYQPGVLPLTPLTNGPWDDAAPALSPDGYRLAFASNRDGAWDLYVLALPTGAVTRLTDTPAYDSSPSWSPDGQWLAYESYTGDGDSGSLDLFIRPLDGSEDPIQLTNDPAADYAPSWSPQGRIIAFVSTRSGESEIWLADLDQVDGRFTNLSHNASAAESHPTWSPDGSRLAWASRGLDGLSTIQVWDASLPEDRPHPAGSGDWPAWNPASDSLAVALDTPNGSYLSAYSLADLSLALTPLRLDGSLAGLVWSSALTQPLALNPQPLVSTPLWTPVLSSAPVPAGRRAVVPLVGIDAPEPRLQDLVDEAFAALREETALLAGWDFLSSLENAFVPLTTPLDPGLGEDWLYTGRAFAFNPVPLNAGWLVVLREDWGPETYWRIFIRTRFQDGSQGLPLHAQPWNFSARFSGDVRAYEQGGALASAIPSGYWLDFTDLALAYGWQRLPALNTWRASYAAARFNEFVLPGGQDWLSAMREIYPPEALNTPTPVPTATDTPTPTPWPTRTPYMTRTPAPTRTTRPTTTPVPTRTPWPTRTLTATSTPWLSPTPTLSAPSPSITTSPVP